VHSLSGSRGNVKVKVKERIVLRQIYLRTTGRHLSVGSHSVICHLTEVCHSEGKAINYLAATVERGTTGILGVGQLGLVCSHLSLRPHLAYDVSAILELAS